MDGGDHPQEGSERSSDRSRFEESLRQRLRDIFGSRPWVVAGEIDNGALRLAGDLRGAGAREVLAVGAMTGSGPPPSDHEIELISMNMSPEGPMAANIQAAHRLLESPPPEITAVVDRFNPAGDARVIGGLTMTEATVLGRKSFGARPPAWRDLEDKLKIEALWARAGIPVAPSAQVAVADRQALLAAHDRLASDLGTVWAGDNSNGWHGGAVGTHWVPDAETAGRLATELDYERVRVMPFLEGVPCSIHGAVLPMDAATDHNPDAVAAFRPTEMMVLRHNAERRLLYGRASSFWDPAPADREAMRSIARSVGAELRRAVDFRGVFTVDGVMSADGFVPTEVNTRYGAALASKIDTEAGDPLDLFLIQLCLVEGLLDGLDLAMLEDWAVAHIDRNRRAVGFFDTERNPGQRRTATLGRDRDGVLHVHSVDASVDDESDAGFNTEEAAGPAGLEPLADVEWVASGANGLLVFSFGDGLEIGPPTAPVLVDAVKAVDRVWEVGAAEVSAAKLVR